MHRFYLDEKIGGIGVVVGFPKDEVAHAARVLRLRKGEEVQLIDGVNLYQAELQIVNEQEVTAIVRELCPSPEPPAQAVLIQGLPKADKLEMIAQKATELGMGELWPVEMERSIAKADKQDKSLKKRERLARIAMEAAKQSGRAYIPQVALTTSFTKMLDALSNAKPSFDAVFIAWEEEHALPMSKAVTQLLQDGKTLERVAIVVGPEGGISQREWEKLHDIAAISVTLGKRILRTETAGLCALAVLWTALGEM